MECSSDRRLVLARELIAIGLTLAGLLIAFSLIGRADGFYHDDDITHYMMAVRGWNDATQAWHNWGRPGYTLPVVVVAHYFGITGARVFSAIVTALVAYLAYRIAVRISLRGERRGDAQTLRRGETTSGGLEHAIMVLAPALAPLAVWAHPLTMQLAQTTLTETPAALYLTLAVWLYLRGNYAWACAALSPAFITRDETMALAPVLAIAVLYAALRQTRFKPLAALKLPWLWLAAGAMIWAPAAKIIADFVIPMPDYLTLLHRFGRSYTGEYGSGAWNHYLMGWSLEAAGGGVLALAAAGAWSVCRQNVMALLKRDGTYGRDAHATHGRDGRATGAQDARDTHGQDARATGGRGGIIVVALAVGLVGLHTMIFMRGMFESGGYMRFLVTGCGLTGALAGCGVAALMAGSRRIPAVLALLTLAGWLRAVDIQNWFGYIQPFSPDGRAIVMWALIVMAMLVLLLPSRDVRQGLSWAAACLAVFMATFQWFRQVYPLPLDSDVMHRSCIQATLQADIDFGPDRPALATHCVVEYLRPTAQGVGSYESARRLWASAAVGTLFFWDNKYGVPYGCEGPVQLLEDLQVGGRCVRRFDNEHASVLVFERSDKLLEYCPPK